MPHPKGKRSQADKMHDLELFKIKMLESYCLIFQVHMSSRLRPRTQTTQPMETVLESFTAFFRDNLISLSIPRQVHFLLETLLSPHLQVFKLKLNLGMGSYLFWYCNKASVCCTLSHERWELTLLLRSYFVWIELCVNLSLLHTRICVKSKFVSSNSLCDLL